MKGLIVFVLGVLAIVPTLVGQDVAAELTTYDINAGDSWQIPFRTNSPATIKGSFESRDNRTDTTVAATAAGSAYLRIPNTVQNNIEILVLDELNYSARAAGRSFVSAYNSGRQTTGKFAVNLKAGKYRFVISNAHSALASKQVTLTLDPATKSILNGENVRDSRNTPRRIFRFIDQSFVVQAGGAMPFPLVLNQAGQLVGRFTTSGGNNDIEFLILDEANYHRWLQGQYFSALSPVGYVSGEQTVECDLSPGRYVVVFNNRKAIITRKRVTAMIGIAHDLQQQ